MMARIRSSSSATRMSGCVLIYSTRPGNLRDHFGQRGGAALGLCLEGTVVREENSRHEALQEAVVEGRAERPEGRGKLDVVTHQRAAVGRLEAMRVTPPLEGAALHLVRETARGFERWRH